MSKTSYQTRIRSRIAELRAAILAAEAEVKELEVAERVLERLSEGSGLAGAFDADVVAPTNRTDKVQTVADAALYALKTRGAMNSADLLNHLHVTWRSDLAQTTLTSTLSRAKKEGRLEYDNGLWSAAAATIDCNPKTTQQDTHEDDLLGALNSATGEEPGSDTPAADVDL